MKGSDDNQTIGSTQPNDDRNGMSSLHYAKINCCHGPTWATVCTGVRPHPFDKTTLLFWNVHNLPFFAWSYLLMILGFQRKKKRAVLMIQLLFDSIILGISNRWCQDTNHTRQYFHTGLSNITWHRINQWNYTNIGMRYIIQNILWGQIWTVD